MKVGGLQCHNLFVIEKTRRVFGQKFSEFRRRVLFEKVPALKHLVNRSWLIIENKFNLVLNTCLMHVASDMCNYPEK